MDHVATSVRRSSAVLGDLIHRAARQHPNRTALKDTRRSHTYADLDARTNRIANGLLGMGLERGDRIAAWMEDSLDYVELHLAAAKSGVVLAPISKLFTAREALIQMEDAGARALAYSPATATRVAELDLGDDVALLACGGADQIGPVSQLDDIRSAASATAPGRPEPTDPYLIGYTSGTTGTPKGAVYTHSSTLQILGMQAVTYRLPLYGTAVFNSSMSFVGTVTAFIWSHFYVGGTVVMAPGLSVGEQLRVLREEHGTFMYLPTPSMSEFVKEVEADPNSIDTLHSILHSGSKATPQMVERVCRVVGHRYIEGYGQTENSGGLVSATTAADALGSTAADHVHASVGRPTVEVEIRILDDSRAALPHDGESIGELWYRSPAIMEGYWNRPDANAESFDDGWFRSGDYASIDRAGYVYIVDRRHDLINSGGANVYPSEVEEVLLDHPLVRECAVVAGPHERWGQTVVAVIVPDGGGLTAEAVQDWCAQRLASYKKPTSVFFRDSFEHSASHKVRRSQVRDEVARMMAGEA